MNEREQAEANFLAVINENPELLNEIRKDVQKELEEKKNGKSNVTIKPKPKEVIPPKLTKKSEIEVLADLLNAYNIFYDDETNQIICNDDTILLKENLKDIFYYNKTHWQLCETPELDQIKRKIDKLYDFNKILYKTDTTFNTFLRYIPSIPRGFSFFKPDPYKANFLDGTLHLIDKDNNRNYEIIFKKHDKKDYLTHVLPFKYHDAENQSNTMFEDMLLRMFEGDEDKFEKISCIQEAFGAALFPVFPHFFLLHGKAGAGKSTLLIILHRLLTQENISRVAPNHFKGFEMASMVGKLVNICTDIPSDIKIEDDRVKEIEDMLPSRISRKNRDDIYAYLPRVHFFGCNEIPSTFEGFTNAHIRRWAFIEFNHSFTDNNTEYQKDFGNIVFDSNPNGIINFSLIGFKRLIKNKAHYSNSKSGLENIKEWQERTDYIQLFINDIMENPKENSEIYERLKNSGGTIGAYLIQRKDMWECYQSWLEIVGKKYYSKIGRNRFYEILKKKNFEVIIVNGVRYFQSRKFFETALRNTL